MILFCRTAPAKPDDRRGGISRQTNEAAPSAFSSPSFCCSFCWQNRHAPGGTRRPRGVRGPRGRRDARAGAEPAAVSLPERALRQASKAISMKKRSRFCQRPIAVSGVGVQTTARRPDHLERRPGFDRESIGQVPYATRNRGCRRSPFLLRERGRDARGCW